MYIICSAFYFINSMPYFKTIWKLKIKWAGGGEIFETFPLNERGERKIQKQKERERKITIKCEFLSWSNKNNLAIFVGEKKKSDSSLSYPIVRINVLWKRQKKSHRQTFYLRLLFSVTYVQKKNAIWICTMLLNSIKYVILNSWN